MKDVLNDGVELPMPTTTDESQAMAEQDEEREYLTRMMETLPEIEEMRRVEVEAEINREIRDREDWERYSAGLWLRDETRLRERMN